MKENYLMKIQLIQNTAL